MFLLQRVAEPVLETADLRRSRKRLEDDKTSSNHNIWMAAQRKGTITHNHQKISQVTNHFKILQNQYIDKVVGKPVESCGQDLQIQTVHRKRWRRKPDKWIWVGPPIRCTCMLTFCERHLK